MDIGNKIQQLRKIHNLSQNEFGEMLHVSRQTVSNWENNKNYPDMGTLKEISDRFGVSFDELLKDDVGLIREMDQVKKRAGKIRGLIVIVSILTAVILMGIVVPKILKVASYDPTEIVSSYDKEGYDIQTSRMAMDIAVYSELFLPCKKFDSVQATDLNWGKYNITIGQSYWPSVLEPKQVSGQIVRNKLTLYDPAILQRPPDNAFEWIINTRDTSLSIEENLTEEFPAMGMSGDRKVATERLKSLAENQMYIGYVSFNEVVEYETVGKMLADHDVMLSWVGLVTSDESHQEVIGMYNCFSGAAYPFDTEKYPFLLGYKGLGSEDDVEKNIEKEVYAKQHFISMLKYMNDNKKFLEMIEPLKYGNDLIEDDYFSGKIKYINDNGLQVYGVAVVADKATLLRLNMHKNVYSIATEKY